MREGEGRAGRREGRGTVHDAIVNRIVVHTVGLLIMEGPRNSDKCRHRLVVSTTRVNIACFHYFVCHPLSHPCPSPSLPLLAFVSCEHLLLQEGVYPPLLLLVTAALGTLVMYRCDLTHMHLATSEVSVVCAHPRTLSQHTHTHTHTRTHTCTVV